MLNDDFLTLLAYPALVIGAVTVWVRGKCRPARLACWVVFSVYVIEVLTITLFPLPTDGAMAATYSETPFFTHLNVVPVAAWLHGEGFGRLELSNIALGVPFGFGAWFVLPLEDTRRVVLLGICASVAIELTQLTIGAFVGFMYRVVDVNDVILNTAGVVAGCVAFHVCAWTARTVWNRSVASRDGFWGYMREVAYRPTEGAS